MSRFILGNVVGGWAVASTMTMLVPVKANAQQLDNIDFETTPAGAIPADNANLEEPYVFSFGTVSFYFESTSGSRSLPRFEAAGVDPQHGFLDGDERDDQAAGGDLGSWFLRQRTTGQVPPNFYVEYNDLAYPISALSGEIWDIDGRSGGAYEQWEVSVLDGDNGEIASALSPRGLVSTNSASLDALPWTFSFRGLESNAARVKRVRIRYVGTVTDVGLAFNNFYPTAASSCESADAAGADCVALDAGFTDASSSQAASPSRDAAAAEEAGSVAVVDETEAGLADAAVDIQVPNERDADSSNESERGNVNASLALADAGRTNGVSAPTTSTDRGGDDGGREGPLDSSERMGASTKANCSCRIPGADSRAPMPHLFGMLLIFAGRLFMRSSRS